MTIKTKIKKASKTESNKKQKGRHFIHDRIFKEVFSYPKYAKGLFQLSSLKKHFHFLDWSTLKLEATTFIDKKGREKRTDLQFSIQNKGSKDTVKLVFLIEHKSYQDPETLLQMLGYQLGIYERIATSKGKPLVKGLMPVIPILIYQGKDKNWKGPRQFQDYLNWTQELKQKFDKNVVNFRPHFLNIASLDLEKEDKSLTIYPVLYILKNIWGLDKAKVREFFKLSRHLSLEDKKFLVKSIASYIHGYDQSFTWQVMQEIEAETIPEKEGKVMSLFQNVLDKEREKGIQAGKQVGVQQGMQQERQQVVLNMLKNRLDTDLICKVTGLSQAEINKLKNGSQ